VDHLCDTLYLTLVESPSFEFDVFLSSKWRDLLDSVKVGDVSTHGWNLLDDSGTITENGTTYRMVTLRRQQLAGESSKPASS
jgi:hypothetical protein